MKRWLSMILVLVMLLGILPMNVFAAEVVSETEQTHTHKYAAEITAPTCTEQGYTTYTCDCGDSYVGDDVDATGHSFSEWEMIKEVSFAEDGEERRDCVKCSHVEFRPVLLTIVTSGNFGYGATPTDKVKYTLYSDGTMVIEGQGALYSNDWRGDDQPFVEYRKLIKHLIIGEGITHTSSGSLAKLSNLETIQFSSTLTHLRQNALMSSFKDTITQITIPKTVVHLGAYSIGHYTGDASAFFTDVIIENPDIQFTDHTAVFNGGAKLDQLTLYSYGTANNVSAYAEKYGIMYVDLNDYLTGEFEGVQYRYADGVLTLSAAQENAIIVAENQPWAEKINSIKTIIIRDGVEGISAGAFRDYEALTTVSLPDDLKSIDDRAFEVTTGSGAPLEMTIPKHIQYLGDNLFAGRKNVTVTAYYGSIAEDMAEPNVELTLKKQFKLLFIGNSYSEDASSGSYTTTSQTLDILQAMLGEDAEVVIGLCYSGGKGMNWHATQAEQGKSSYNFKVISTKNPKWESLGAHASADALAWTDWDAVSLQPYGINAATGKESVSYPEATDPKFYYIEASSTYMLDHVACYAPYADVYFYMHWALTSGATLNAALNSYNKQAEFMPQVLTYAGTESGKRFKTIVPVGLSIQNARTTYLALLQYNTTAYDDGNLNLITDAQIGLQRDPGHLSFNIGRYIAGLTFAEMVVPESLRVEGYVLPEIRATESVGKLPSEYSEIAQKSVFAAVENWQNGNLAVTSIEDYTEDPTVAASDLLQSTQFLLNNEEESLITQLEIAVLATLPVDFAISKIEINENTMTAEVTIRFGYTSATVNVSYTTDDPIITQQPESVNVSMGENYCITVEAKGEGLKYQWYFRNAGSNQWYKSSVKDNTYDDVMTAARAGREVYCVITDANGNSVTTDTARLTCLPFEELAIVTQPTDGAAVLGERYCVTVEAKGDGLKYQWYFRNAGSNQWYKSSVKDNTYDDVMTAARAGREVYCVITDANGNFVTTDTARLTCFPSEELAIVAQPTDGAAVLGERYCVTVEAKGDGLKYQWYFRNKGATDWTKSGVTDNIYDDVMTKARASREIYCVITDIFGNKVATDVVKLIAIPKVELRLLGLTYESAVMGGHYCVTVEAQGDGLRYQWYFRNAGTGDWYKSGVTDNTYDDVMTKARANREVYCIITDACGNQIVTEAVTLAVTED